MSVRRGIGCSAPFNGHALRGLHAATQPSAYSPSKHDLTEGLAASAVAIEAPFSDLTPSLWPNSAASRCHLTARDSYPDPREAVLNSLGGVGGAGARLQVSGGRGMWMLCESVFGRRPVVTQ